MSKFDATLDELKTKFSEIKNILVVFVYGSVARGDHSERHSDLDLFIIINKKKVDEKLKDKINHLLWPVGSKNGVKVHIEYQGLVIDDEDKSLVEKMIEEGKVVYSSGVFVFDGKQIGLKQYIIYSMKAQDNNTKTRLSQILHGRKSWYYNGKKKIVKEYDGLIDNEDIIDVGKGSLMVVNDKRKDIEKMFNDLRVEFKIIKIVYG